MIDARTRAVEKAAAAIWKHLGKEIQFPRALILAFAAIEAYEAAKWRPIKEAPRDGSVFYVYISGAYIQPGLMVWRNGELRTPLDRVIETDIEHLTKDGAMFRTIDPPQANASKSSS